MARFIASMGSLVTALDCFARVDGGALGMPYFASVIVGLFWLAWSGIFLFSRRVDL
ncbi:hypothetical protein M2336_001706 [Sphingobium sp. B1D7B]|nr:hypothetical protein [Sphingobium sp. B1D7B]